MPTSVIFDSSGDIYGTTYVQGSNGDGVVFKFTPASDGKVDRWPL